MKELKKGLVSIITPCYNTAKYLPSLMDSILMQTYDKVEMFAVNDGSNDNTETILESYINLFKEKGYSLSVINQENSGQSVAVNNALKLISGEFLVWPDSDDYFKTPEAIERMVEQLTSNPKVGMVRVQEFLVDEDTLLVKGLNGKKNKPLESTSIFEDCLYVSNGFYFPPGGYMIKTEIIEREIGMDIYTEKKAGQNWQLLLPVLYTSMCASIVEPLYCVRVRTASHSRGQFKGYKEQIDVMSSYENTIINTLRRISSMSSYVSSRYINSITRKYVLEKFFLSLKFGVYSDSLGYMGTLRERGINTNILNALVIISKTPIICKLTNILCKLFRRYQNGKYYREA